MSSFYERTESYAALSADTTLTASQDKSVSGTVIFCMRPQDLLITLKATPSASSTSAIDFRFVARCNEGDPWPTVPTFTKSITLAGTGAQSHAVAVDCRAYAEIKLISVKSNDGANTMSAVNAVIAWKV